MRWTHTLAALAFVLASCDAKDGDEPEDLTPRCDGQLQPDEGTVDAPWDQDGDGFFDKEDPGCQATFATHQLDCDDSDPAINPTAIELPCNGVDDDCVAGTQDDPDNDGDGVGSCEDCNDNNASMRPDFGEDVCFDGLDNDCDGIADNDCGDDYNGDWVVDPAFTWNCNILGQPLMGIDWQSMNIIYDPPYVSTLPVPLFTGGVLEGEIDPDTGDFTFAKTVGGMAGTCQEDYSLIGTFTSADTLEATFVMDLTQTFPLVCGPCTLQPQEWTFTATRSVAP